MAFPNNSSFTVSTGVQNHPGRIRTENQDRVSRASTPFGDLYILADGVGGQGGGADAAQQVVEGFAEYLRAHPDLRLPDALRTAARETGARLRRRSEEAGQARSMSSTVVLAVIRGHSATVAHAGDSRAYLARDGRLRLLTRDDSLVEQMVSQGIITPEQARSHPDASVLTQAIGQSSELDLSVTEFDLRAGDSLLLCSDGLWGYARHAEMEAIALAPNLSAGAASEALLNLALQGGGGDNISLQLLRFSAAWTPASVPVRWFGMKLSLAIPVTLATAGILGAGGFATYLNFRVPLYEKNPGMPAIVPLIGVAAPSRVKPRVMLVAAEDSAPPEWSATVRAMSSLDVRDAKGAPGCLKLRQPKAALWYRSSGASAARELARTLGLPDTDVRELPAESLTACGEADLFVLPARP
jgi:protein phosphatase